MVPAQQVDERMSDPVRTHMRTDYTLLQHDQTIAESLAQLRANPPSARVIYFYVVDKDQRLLGVVPTRRLLLNDPQKSIKEIMVGNVIAIPEHATVMDACEFFILHRLLAFPIVDRERRIVGMVDIDLYTGELAELNDIETPGGDDLFQLIGVHLTDSQQLSPGKSFRGRFPWLIANILGGILAAILSGFFEVELQKAVALALFIPVVLALAESVSIQSVSLALQSLHGQPPTVAALLRKVRAELMTGGLLGLASALSVATVALIWLGHIGVVICLLVGIAGGVTAASVIGMAVPNLIRIFRQEPQVAAGPIALACADMVTLLLYFLTARMVV